MGHHKRPVFHEGMDRSFIAIITVVEGENTTIYRATSDTQNHFESWWKMLTTNPYLVCNNFGHGNFRIVARTPMEPYFMNTFIHFIPLERQRTSATVHTTMVTGAEKAVERGRTRQKNDQNLQTRLYGDPSRRVNPRLQRRSPQRRKSPDGHSPHQVRITRRTDAQGVSVEIRPPSLIRNPPSPNRHRAHNKRQRCSSTPGSSELSETPVYNVNNPIPTERFRFRRLSETCENLTNIFKWQGERPIDLSRRMRENLEVAEAKERERLVHEAAEELKRMKIVNPGYQLPPHPLERTFIPLHSNDRGEVDVKGKGKAAVHSRHANQMNALDSSREKAKVMEKPMTGHHVYDQVVQPYPVGAPANRYQRHPGPIVGDPWNTEPPHKFPVSLPNRFQGGMPPEVPIYPPPVPQPFHGQPGEIKVPKRRTRKFEYSNMASSTDDRFVEGANQKHFDGAFGEELRALRDQQRKWNEVARLEIEDDAREMYGEQQQPRERNDYLEGWEGHIFGSELPVPCASPESGTVIVTKSTDQRWSGPSRLTGSVLHPLPSLPESLRKDVLPKQAIFEGRRYLIQYLGYKLFINTYTFPTLNQVGHPFYILRFPPCRYFRPEPINTVEPIIIATSLEESPDDSITSSLYERTTDDLSLCLDNLKLRMWNADDVDGKKRKCLTLGDFDEGRVFGVMSSEGEINLTFTRAVHESPWLFMECDEFGNLIDQGKEEDGDEKKEIEGDEKWGKEEIFDKKEEDAYEVVRT